MNSVISNIKVNVDMLNDELKVQKGKLERGYLNIKHIEEHTDRIKKELTELHSALKVLENSEELLGNVDIPQKSAPKL